MTNLLTISQWISVSLSNAYRWKTANISIIIFKDYGDIVK